MEAVDNDKRILQVWSFEWHGIREKLKVSKMASMSCIYLKDVNELEYWKNKEDQSMDQYYSLVK